MQCLNKTEQKICLSDFSLSELEFALSNTKGKKAAGANAIYPELLKNLGNTAKLALLNLINLTWKTRGPQQWRKGEIISITKKGKPSDTPEGYRPITLTSACCKVAERMVVRRLNQFFEMNAVIDECQAGFRAHRCTMDQVVYFAQSVKDGYHKKMSSLAVMVDLKNAYDTVWRPMLLHKLALSGVAGNLFNWIASFLSQRQIRVRYNDCLSEYRIQRQGLPQGAVISCSLFNLMVNDILVAVRCVPGVQALLYADDLIIWATSSHIMGLEATINSALVKLEEWAKLNAMTVNTTKTTYQLFSLSTRRPTVNLRYCGSELEEVNMSKYLGVNIDTRMTWKHHIEQSANLSLIHI